MPSMHACHSCMQLIQDAFYKRLHIDFLLKGLHCDRVHERLQCDSLYTQLQFHPDMHPIDACMPFMHAIAM